MGRRDDSGDDPVPVGEGEAIHKTDLALLVQLEDGYKYWIPFSVIHEDSELYGVDEGENEGELILKQWWYDENGLVPVQDDEEQKSQKSQERKKRNIRW